MVELRLGGEEEGLEGGGSSAVRVVEIENQMEFLMIGRRFRVLGVWGVSSSSATEERRGDRVYVMPFGSRVLAMEEERECEMCCRSSRDHDICV